MAGDEEKCAFCGTTKDLQTHHWLYNEEYPEKEWIATLCVECHKKVHGHGVGRGRGYTLQMGEKRFEGGIEIRKYKIRSAGGKVQTGTKEITLPQNWVRKHGLEVGSAVSVITNDILIIIPPGASRKEEDKALAFAMEGDSEK